MADSPERYYATLGLRPGASFKEVRQAYLDLTNVWHPDRFTGNPRLKRKAEAQFMEINTAYERLCALQQAAAPVPRQAVRQQAMDGGWSTRLPMTEIMAVLILVGVLAVLAVIVLACQQLNSSPEALAPLLAGLV